MVDRKCSRLLFTLAVHAKVTPHAPAASEAFSPVAEHPAASAHSCRRVPSSQSSPAPHSAPADASPRSRRRAKALPFQYANLRARRRCESAAILPLPPRCPAHVARRAPPAWNGSRCSRSVSSKGALRRALALPSLGREHAARFAGPLARQTIQRKNFRTISRGVAMIGDVRRTEEQREAFAIDLPQMRVAREQHRTFEDGAFRENERVVRLLIRQQPLCADFRRDGVNDAVPRRHEVHGLDSQTRRERTERGLRGGSHVVFIGELAEPRQFECNRARARRIQRLATR